MLHSAMQHIYFTNHNGTTFLKDMHLNTQGLNWNAYFGNLPIAIDFIS